MKFKFLESKVPPLTASDEEFAEWKEHKARAITIIFNFVYWTMGILSLLALISLVVI